MPEQRGQRGINRRAGRAGFGDRVFTVKEIQGGTVVANEGNRGVPVAQVLLAREGSTRFSLAGIRRALGLRRNRFDSSGDRVSALWWDTFRILAMAQRAPIPSQTFDTKWLYVSYMLE